ncbi:MAG: phosphate/phosphite/phosphonate ABC transporter substrate-binding protein [Nitrospirae bacterium]|nr:phosphate/phosphite/phosphonate ABC transporter substrate-binding protein [Nitrospirota bacterium]
MKYLFVFLFVFMFSGFSHAAELTIGLIPEQNIFKQLERYKPLGAYIEKKTGVRIKFTVLSRYGNIIENFYKKKMDGAFWGSFTGAMAIKKLNIEFLARPVNLDGNSTYHGLIFVHKSSVIKDVADMKDKTIAFVDKATTAGYVFPKAYFKQHGVKNIEGYFKEYYFAGSHDAAIYAVVDKKADIGCAKNSMLDRLIKENPEIKENLTILARSPDVPSNGLGLRKDIPFGVKSDIKRALLDMDSDPDGKEVLKNFGALRFIETKESDYEPVLKMAEEAGINTVNYEYDNK